MKHTCTFTGHRPEHLAIPQAQVIQWLEEQIERAADEGYTNFITGMQRGVDLLAAEAVLKLIDKDRQIRLIAACAFRGMEEDWETDWKERYYYVLSRSELVYYISDHPDKRPFLDRNHWMVDRASRLIAVYTGAPGDTKETIEYARKKNLDIMMIER
ncbi:SLOG family protein [Ruminococcus sp.]|uniref:SLOG family protein n=1 Tax=Ruminococcus sp. TaxID=41978 RepID=UPI00386D7F40